MSLFWWFIQVGDVIMQKTSLGGTLVYGGAIVMSFIGVGFSMFSLSRLQNSSERRTLIAEVFKWSTTFVQLCLFSVLFRGCWTKDCFSSAYCCISYLLRTFSLPIYLCHDASVLNSLSAWAAVRPCWHFTWRCIFWQVSRLSSLMMYNIHCIV